MQRTNRDPRTAETGERVAARPHDSGSQANETIDGLESTTEALRHAAGFLIEEAKSKAKKGRVGRLSCIQSL